MTLHTLSHLYYLVAVIKSDLSNTTRKNADENKSKNYFMVKDLMFNARKFFMVWKEVRWEESTDNQQQNIHNCNPIQY